MTSWTAAPTSQSLASMPAVLIPVSVASCTARNKGLNLSLKASVQAQSIIRPYKQIISGLINIIKNINIIEDWPKNMHFQDEKK